MKNNIKDVCLSFNGLKDSNPYVVVINFNDVIYFDANNVFEHKIKYTYKNRHVFTSVKESREVVIHISPRANINTSVYGKSFFEYMHGRDDLTDISFINMDGEVVDSISIPWSDEYKDYKIDASVNDKGEFMIGIKPCEIDWGKSPFDDDKSEIKRWKITNNSEEQFFDSFDDAVKYFKHMIRKHIIDNKDVFDWYSIPSAMGSFLFYKYNHEITDEEIVISKRAELLMENLLVDKDPTLVIQKEYHYKGAVKECNEELVVDIVPKDDEIVFELSLKSLGEEEMLTRTNAFIFSDNSKKYYFNSHNIITSSSTPDNLGKSVVLYIQLEKCNG